MKPFATTPCKNSMVVAFISIFIFSSCQKELPGTAAGRAEVDVYVAGMEVNGSYGVPNTGKTGRLYRLQME